MLTINKKLLKIQHLTGDSSHTQNMLSEYPYYLQHNTTASEGSFLQPNVHFTPRKQIL
jgi:hypothetical protein